MWAGKFFHVISPSELPPDPNHHLSQNLANIHDIAENPKVYEEDRSHWSQDAAVGSDESEELPGEVGEETRDGGNGSRDECHRDRV